MAGATKEMRAMEWRASRRGTLEVSMILSSYLKKNRCNMGASELESMKRLLDLPDADLWDILVAEKTEASRSEERLVGDLRAHAKTIHANSER